MSVLKMTQSSLQQGIATSGINYFDVMMIGITGQGKSTATDKLLVASPTGCRETFTLDDFTLWYLDKKEDEEERQRTRVKNLTFYSALENAHEEINAFHKSDMLTAESTKECEVFSNDKTKTRVLDVPGFYDRNSITSTSLMSASSDIFGKNLTTMRRILQIQMALNMCFHRVLYFLPTRGPLESPHAILQAELKLLVHYFGLTFLKTVVLVATVRKRFSERSSMSDEDIFDQEERKQTLDVFSAALRLAFPNDIQTVDEIKPPIILLRLSDTCETVLKKVQKAEVANDRLTLQLNPNTCGKCGVKIGTVQEEKVVCYHEQGPIPYSDSKCHPVFEPKYPVKERCKQILSLGIYKPVFKEVCAGCHEEAGSPPCMKITEEFRRKKKPPIVVDHENAVRLPEIVEENPNQFDLAASGPQDGPSLQVGVGYQGAATRQTEIDMPAEENPEMKG